MLKRIWSLSTLFVLFLCITASYKSSVLGNTSNPRLSRDINASEIFWRGRRSKTSSTIIRVSKVNPVIHDDIFPPTALPIVKKSITGPSGLSDFVTLDTVKTENAFSDQTLSSLHVTTEQFSEPTISIPTLVPNQNENIKNSVHDELAPDKVIFHDPASKPEDKKENLVPSPVASTGEVEASQETIQTKDSSTEDNSTVIKDAQEEERKLPIVEKEKKANDSVKTANKAGAYEIEAPPSEVMPSFDEWKKKMLAEQQQSEGEKPVQINSIPGKKPQTPSSKRRRNYASSECGAKIMASNGEAEAPNRILNEQMDMYMLNPCKAKIWFIIELCETIQTTQFELANFELFSSLPHEFSIYWSDRYPTRDWMPLGTFIAPDQRALHNFDLKQHGYGKFLKVELHSYYGREHYCPLSLVRVYGTSMVDEYEEMETGGLNLHPHLSEADGDTMDSPAYQEAEDDSSKNLFGSARDAVLNIVRKAARALGREEIGKSNLATLASADAGMQLSDEENITSAISPNKTTHSLWKNTAGLGRLLDDCGLCVESEEDSPCFHSLKCLFFLSIFNISTVAQFCQTSACSLVTMSYTNNTILVPELKKVPIKFEPVVSSSENVLREKATAVQENSTDSVIYIPPFSEDSSQQELKTKASEEDSLTDKIIVNVPSPVSLPTKELPQGIPILQSSLSDFSTRPLQTGQASSLSVSSFTTASSLTQSETIMATVTPEIDELQGDNLMLDEEGMKEAVRKEPFNPQIDISHTIPVRNLGVLIPTGQKESVFMRLSNRIKVLEMNMSLSSLYLQELSQRYRRQMEDMQRGFNRTVAALNDTAQLAERRDKQQQEAIRSLQVIVTDLKNSVDQLTSERESFYRQVLEAHLFLLVVETIVVITVMTLCMRRMRYSFRKDGDTNYYENLDLEKNQEVVKRCSSPLKRHNSTNDLMENLLPGKKRRPSEVVSYSGSYSELLIVEPAMPIYIEPGSKNKKKNRHRKSHRSLARSISNPNLNENRSERCPNCSAKKTDGERAVSSVAGDLLGACRTSTKCENCCFFVPSLPTIISPVKPLKIPLQNVTNGAVSPDETSQSSREEKAQPTIVREITTPIKEQFSFRKLLKFRKNEAV